MTLPVHKAAAPALLLVWFVTIPRVVQAHGNFAAGQVDLSAAKVEPSIRPFDVGRSAPALVALGGELFMVWRGNHDDFNLVLGRVDLQSGNLEEKITFAEATITAPALAVFNGSLLIAWTGTDHHLRIGQVSFPDHRLLPSLRLEETSSSAPALAAFSDRIVLGWRGAGNKLNLGRVDFGTRRLEDRVTLSDKCKASPALATSLGSLFISWTGTNGRLNFGYFNGAPHPISNPSWTAKFPNLDESSGQAPGLAVLGGIPRIGWTGTDAKHTLNVAAFDLGARRLTGKIRLPETSDAGPALTTSGGELSIAWHRSHKGHREVRLQFPGSVPRFCSIKDVPKLQVYPAVERHTVIDLFNTIYPEIVAVYGEPLGGVDVKVYGVPGDASMYLSHKSGTPAKVLTAIVAASLGLPAISLCAALTEIPDQSLFLARIPGDDGFEHHFTHEIIHTFHDPMDFLGWYDRSWIEEGMTEATAELVALRLLRPGGRDVQGTGINGSPADNLKHYDAWSYPFNGAWRGNHPGFSVLGGIQFFFGGIAIPPLGDEKFANKVIDPQVRYAAAAALWLMLTQRFSTDPLRPDFLRRLNEQLDRDGIREMADDSSDTLLRTIEKVVGDAQIEELPVREWLLRQALLKGAPEFNDFLFIDVRNPENLRLEDPNNRPITIYAIAKEDISNPANPLGQLAVGELPARNCDVEVTIRDAAGHAWVDKERGKTEPDGRYVVKQVVALPAGAYSIYATADDCDRVYEGPRFPEKTFLSHVPDGMSASTYAIVGGAGIGGPDSVLRGVTARPRVPSFFPGSRPFIEVVRASVAASIVRPAFRDLATVDDARGAFTVDTFSATDLSNPLSFVPFEIDITQAHPGGRKNHLTLLKPNPYTRVVWLGTSPDFSLELAPNQGAITPGGTGTAVVRLTPNGVRRGELPGCRVFSFLVPGRAPAGVSVELPVGSERLSSKAPDPTDVPMTIRVGVGVGTAPGTYDLEFQASGFEDCAPIVRTATYRLQVLPAPVQAHMSIDALRQAPPAAPIAAGVAITVMTDAGTEVFVTPFDLTLPTGAEFFLEAELRIYDGGQPFDFVTWELNGDAGQQSGDNPIRLTAAEGLSVTARYALAANGGPVPIPTASTLSLCLLTGALAASALLLLRLRSAAGF